MPTYQYACTVCDHRFEAVQSFSDAALSDCPECSGRLRKLYGSVGVVFKGSGFYRTDSRSGGKKSSDSSSTSSPSPSSSPSTSTTSTTSTSSSPSKSTSSSSPSTAAKAS